MGTQLQQFAGNMIPEINMEELKQQYLSSASAFQFRGKSEPPRPGTRKISVNVAALICVHPVGLGGGKSYTEELNCFQSHNLLMCAS